MLREMIVCVCVRACVMYYRAIIELYSCLHLHDLCVLHLLLLSRRFFASCGRPSHLVFVVVVLSNCQAEVETDYGGGGLAFVCCCSWFCASLVFFLFVCGIACRAAAMKNRPVSLFKCSCALLRCTTGPLQYAQARGPPAENCFSSFPDFFARFCPSLCASAGLSFSPPNSRPRCTGIFVGSFRSLLDIKLILISPSCLLLKN